jgi:hypothetical protein
MDVVFADATAPPAAIAGKDRDTWNRLGRAPSPTIFALNSATLNAILFSYIVELFIRTYQRLL